GGESDRADRGAVREGAGRGAGGLRGELHEARPGPPGHLYLDGVSRRGPRPHHLRATAGRDRARLLRQAQVDQPGIRVPGLRVLRAEAGGTCPDGPALERGERGRALGHRAPREGVRVGSRCFGEAQGADSEADVSDRRPGDDRKSRHRAGDHPRDAEERPREMLRRRYHAQEKASRETARGEETYEAGGHGPDSARGISRGPARGAIGPRWEAMEWRAREERPRRNRDAPRGRTP